MTDLEDRATAGPASASRPGRSRGLATRAAGLLLAGLTGCVATTPTAPEAGGAASSPTVTRRTVIPFGAERQAQVRQRLERQGWGHLVTTLARSSGSETAVELLVFVDPASVARYGNVARARVLHSRAIPVNDSAAEVMFQQFDCGARTLQIVAIDRFSDSEATTRISTTNLPGPVGTVIPRSLGEILLDSICVGRFAAANRPATNAAGAVSITPRTTTPPPPPTPPRGGTGSGVAVATGLVLTNAHVVARCSAVEVVQQGRRLPATVRQRDTARDLALLAAPDLPALPYPALRQQAAVGEPVMAAGYPLGNLLGSDVVVTDGIVNTLSGFGERRDVLQMSAQVQPGNSGGPLLDRGGHVVGLVVAQLNALATMLVTGNLPQNVNFAIKPEVVADFLEAQGVPTRRVAGGGQLDTQQLAALARNFTVKIDCKP